MTTQMNCDSVHKANDGGPLILVVQDGEETRNGIEALLTADGTRDEEDTVLRIQRIAQEDAGKQVKDFEKTVGCLFVSFCDPDIAVAGSVSLAKRAAPPFQRCGKSRA